MPEKRYKAQDIFVLLSLLVFSTILILGLLPRTDSTQNSLYDSFLNTTMMVPVIIAVYFIIISFRRQVSVEFARVTTSIRTKIMLALLFVSVMPTLPIILISNNIISRAINELFSAETELVLDEAVSLAESEIDHYKKNLKSELEWYSHALDEKYFNITDIQVRTQIRELLHIRSIHYQCYFLEDRGFYNTLRPLLSQEELSPLDLEINSFLSLVDLDKPEKIYKITHRGEVFLVALHLESKLLSALYLKIPEQAFTKVEEFKKAKSRYARKNIFGPFVQNAVGLFLLILSIAVVLLAFVVSYFLSRSLTRPVFELIEASNQVAKGDFSVRVKRSASDELSLLFNSFNLMVRQLGDSRKAFLHIQKLEAWKEVGSKLMHEIKNPLTPIRLSAERIRRKYFESASNIDDVVKAGTETIIEEVDALQHIMREFSQFARLPQAKLEHQQINEIIANCIKLFHGHEKIVFAVDLDESIPEIKIDRILIRQVFINIIKNAIEAMSFTGNIEISSRLSDQNVEISIADEGPGISDEDIGKLFEPTFSKKPNGTGLGLAIVDKIIVEHGGTIRCSSHPGKGATFHITLPIKE